MPFHPSRIVRRGLAAAALLSLALVAPALAGPPAAEVVLAGHDPVALCGGREVPGLDSITEDRGNWRYRFASEANRARFRADPLRWGVQIGGACARMGPLTGLGSPDRWLVHDGRIYLFASERCRDRFRAAPERFVERADPVPEPTPGEAARGRALLERAAEGFGGARAVDGTRSLRVAVRAGHAGADSVSHAVREYWWEFPGRHRYEERWRDRPFGHALDGGTGTGIAADVVTVVDEQVLAHIRREYWRHPFVLVRERNAPGLVVRWAGRDSVAGVAVELVEVAADGATTTLAVEPGSGRVLQARLRGRSSDGIAPLEQTFGDYRPVADLRWPFAQSSVLGGRPVESPRLEVVDVSVNPVLDPRLFRPAE